MQPVRKPSPLSPIHEGGEDECEEGSPSTAGTKARGNWKNAFGKVSQETSETAFITPDDKPEATKSSGWNKVRKVQLNDQRPATLQLRDSQPLSPERETYYLHEGQSHQVWRPKKSPQLANLVKDVLKAKKEQERKSMPTTPGTSKTDLRSRQRTLYSRVLATQAVLKETNDELLEEEEEEEEDVEDEVEARARRKSKLTLHAATKKISANILKQKSAESDKKTISDVVSQYLAQARSEVAAQKEETQNASNRRASRHKTVRKQNAITPGAIPVKKWRQIVRENEALGKLTEMSQESDHSDDEVEAMKSKVKSKSPRNSAVSFAEFHSDNQKLSSTKSPGVSTPDGEPLHKPILKKDSHGILKKSRLAEVKATTARRQSYQRQDPLQEWSTSPGTSLEDSGEHPSKKDNSKSSKKSSSPASARFTELPPINGNANTNNNNNGDASNHHNPTVISHVSNKGSLDDQFPRPGSPLYFVETTPPPRKASPSDIFIAMRNQDQRTPPSQSRASKSTQKMRLKRNVNSVADVSEEMRSQTSSSSGSQSEEPYNGSWI